MKRNQFIISGLLATAIFSSPIMAGEGHMGDKMMDDKHGMMKKDHGQMTHDTMMMLKDVMGILKHLNHKPSSDEKKRLGMMMDQIDGMMDMKSEVKHDKKMDMKKDHMM